MSLSFRQRVLLLVAGLVVIVQLATFTAVLTTIKRGVEDTTRTELARADDRVEQLLGRRSDLLFKSAGILAADFGFRAAIASADAMTIRSALENNLSRVDADVAMLLDLNGRLVATTRDDDIFHSTGGDAHAHAALVRAAEQGGKSLSTVVLAERAHQVVVVPVKAPLTLGWLLLGFSLDDQLATQIGKQVDMQVSFTSRGDTSAIRSVEGSTLAQAKRRALPQAMQLIEDTAAGQSTEMAGETFLTRELDLSGVGTVGAILQTSLDLALADYRKLRMQLMLLTAISVALALFLAFRFARSVTRPIEILAKAVRRAGDGDYTTPPEIERDDELGQLANAFSTMQDGIAEREATISHRALHDELTQLPNRRLARERLEQSIAQAHRHGNSLVVILIGIERYRQIVSSLGHPVGERLLSEIATRLTARTRTSDTIARVAADEFLIVLNDTDELGAEAFLDELIPRLSQPVTLDAAELVPVPVAGLVLAPDTATDAASALHRASIALADSREADVNRAWYVDGGDERHLKRLALVADLKRAVSDDELFLQFQPKVSLADGRAHSCEALVRWIHPEHGFMPPDEFIGLAEDSGNISLLTDWVLNSAIGQAAAWSSENIEMTVAVNLSALDLQDDSLPARVTTLLAEHGVAPERLILEVTESAMMGDIDQAVAILATLRSHGIKLSIDDFGTGYSSLAKLRDLPIDELKIDRAFVTGLTAGGVDELIVRTVIDLGHGLNLSITTEGVETDEERQVLSDLGCDVIQGYFYSRPLNSADFSAWYRAQAPAGPVEKAA